MYNSFREVREGIPRKGWRCLADNPTCSKTAANCRRYIRQIFTVVDNIRDTIGAHGLFFKRRWFDPNIERSNYYAPFGKQASRWLILHKAESLFMVPEIPSYLLTQVLEYYKADLSW